MSAIDIAGAIAWPISAAFLASRSYRNYRREATEVGEFGSVAALFQGLGAIHSVLWSAYCIARLFGASA